MIVLDTNVVSEAMKPEPDPAVRAWLNDRWCLTLTYKVVLGMKSMPKLSKRGLQAPQTWRMCDFSIITFDASCSALHVNVRHHPSFREGRILRS